MNINIFHLLLWHSKHQEVFIKDIGTWYMIYDWQIIKEKNVFTTTVKVLAEKLSML